MKNKEIKLGIGVAVLCVILFGVLLGIGSLNKDKGHATDNDVTEENIQNTTEDLGTESISTESLGTEIENSELTGTEEGPADTQEYVSFAIADVTNYVNVRQEPNTDSTILGKIYDGAVAQIMSTVGEGDNMWFQIISGNVEGYIKAEFQKAKSQTILSATIKYISDETPQALQTHRKTQSIPKMQSTRLHSRRTWQLRLLTSSLPIFYEFFSLSISFRLKIIIKHSLSNGCSS